MGALIDYYHRAGVSGVFGVCQSSEMFHMNRQERENLAWETIKAAKGKLPVILSGHVSVDFDEQVDELNAMMEMGPQAVVLVTNRLARSDEDDKRWFANLEKLLSRLADDIPLGLYECPHPYKRLLNPDLLYRCTDMGRFCFLKDTCCDLNEIAFRLKAISGTDLKLYNANAATLLDSLRAGAAGYSGVMANFHPQLYVKLCRNWKEDPESADKLMDFLGPASVIEQRCYPVNAKYHLSLEGIPFGLNARSRNPGDFRSFHRLEVEQLHRLTQRITIEAT